jgi:N-acetylglucosamine-6-phosphate deacetylase
VFANLVEMTKVTPVEAAMMTSTVQAREHGLHDRGRLAEGLLADLVVLDNDWCVRQTHVGGEVVYAHDGASAS